MRELSDKETQRMVDIVNLYSDLFVDKSEEIATDYIKSLSPGDVEILMNGAGFEDMKADINKDSAMELVFKAVEKIGSDAIERTLEEEIKDVNILTKVNGLVDDFLSKKAEHGINARSYIESLKHNDIRFLAEHCVRNELIPDVELWSNFDVAALDAEKWKAHEEEIAIQALGVLLKIREDEQKVVTELVSETIEVFQLCVATKRPIFDITNKISDIDTQRIIQFALDKHLLPQSVVTSMYLQLFGDIHDHANQLKDFAFLLAAAKCLREQALVTSLVCISESLIADGESK